MDIEKVKELALANGFKLKEQASGNMDLNAYVYDFANAVERELKAHAVPEGYVLASKEPSADLVNHGHQVFLGHFNEGGQTGGRSLYFAYKAMIEAQEKNQ